MRIRKIFPILGMMTLLSSVLVYAKSSILLPESMENILVFLFNTLPEGVRSESTLAIVYFKMLLWVFVFAAVYSSLKKVMHDQNRVAVVGAIVISLSSVMLIPNNIIILIFGLYSTVIAILLALLPLLILLYFNKKIFGDSGGAKKHWQKGLMFILGAMVMLFLAVAIAESSSGGEFYSELGRWMEIGAVVLFFVGIIMFLEGAGDMVKGNYGARSGRDWDMSGGGRGSTPTAQTGPNAVINRINNVENLINSYQSIFREYQNRTNQVLRINNQNVNQGHGINNLNQNGLRRALIVAQQLSNRLDSLFPVIDQEIMSVFSHVDFSRLEDRESQRIVDLSISFAQVQSQVTNFTIESNNRYSAGQLP